MYFKYMPYFTTADKIVSPYWHNVLYLLRAVLAILGKTGASQKFAFRVCSFSCTLTVYWADIHCSGCVYKHDVFIMFVGIYCFIYFAYRAGASENLDPIHNFHGILFAGYHHHGGFNCLSP